MNEEIRKFNLEIALKADNSISLKELLNLYDIDNIEFIYTNIFCDKLCDKKKMINKIYKELTCKQGLCNIISNFIQKEFDELKELIRNNGDITNSYVKIYDYCFLERNGIAYKINCNDELHIIIPKEILDVLNNMNINENYKQVRENTKVFELLNSCINLYGAIEKDKFFELCNKYYGIIEDDINFKSLFINHINFNFRLSSINDSDYYFFKKDDLLDEDFENIKLLTRLTDTLFDFGYKEIELDELLKYNDLFYAESTKGTEEFIDYFVSKNVSKETAESIIEHIINTFRRDYYDGIIFLKEIFDDEKIEINKDNLDEIMFLVNKCINEVPLWGNRGWTNNEIVLNKIFFK